MSRHVPGRVGRCRRESATTTPTCDNGSGQDSGDAGRFYERFLVLLPAISTPITVSVSVTIAIPVAKPLITLTPTPAPAAPATMSDFLHHRLIEDGGRLINYDAVGRGGRSAGSAKQANAECGGRRKDE